MNAEQVRERLHSALQRGHRKATEDEVAEVAAIVLAITAELATELAVVIEDLQTRVAALESA